MPCVNCYPWPYIYMYRHPTFTQITRGSRRGVEKPHVFWVSLSWEISLKSETWMMAWQDVVYRVFYTLQTHLLWRKGEKRKTWLIGMRYSIVFSTHTIRLSIFFFWGEKDGSAPLLTSSLCNNKQLPCFIFLLLFVLFIRFFFFFTLYSGFWEEKTHLLVGK